MTKLLNSYYLLFLWITDGVFYSFCIGNSITVIVLKYLILKMSHVFGDSSDSFDSFWCLVLFVQWLKMFNFDPWRIKWFISSPTGLFRASSFRYTAVKTQRIYELRTINLNRDWLWKWKYSKQKERERKKVCSFISNMSKGLFEWNNWLFAL